MIDAFYWYGVSFGNGNDGVSQLFPNYYVRTSSPYYLARLAQLSQFREPDGVAWCDNNLEVEGEAEFGISAVLYDPPCDDTEDGEYPDLGYDEETGEDLNETAEDGRHWCEFNGAWSICEVFRVEGDDMRDTVPQHETLDECFGLDFINRHPDC